MSAPNHSIIRHRVVPAADARPNERDGIHLCTVVSVVVGRLVGEIDRTVHHAAYGETTILYGVTIDDLKGPRCVGIADIELDGECVPDTLRDLAKLSEVLADEIDKLSAQR